VAPRQVTRSLPGRALPCGGGPATDRPDDRLLSRQALSLEGGTRRILRACASEPWRC